MDPRHVDGGEEGRGHRRRLERYPNHAARSESGRSCRSVRQEHHVDHTGALASRCQRLANFAKLFGVEERDRFFAFKDTAMEGLLSEDVERVNPQYTEEHIKMLESNPEALHEVRSELHMPSR
jgi:hypothetical protein